MSEEMNDQMQVRRQKLQELIDLGIDPFGHRFDRSSTSSELKEQWDQFSCTYSRLERPNSNLCKKRSSWR